MLKKCTMILLGIMTTMYMQANTQGERDNNTKEISYEEHAIELIEHLFNEKVLEAASIAGGYSGSNIIRVLTKDKNVVVRFWNMQWAEDYPQDLACQRIASSAGYAPYLYYSDEKTGITVMDYIETTNPLNTNIKFQAIVRLLNAVHSGPSFSVGIDRKADFYSTLNIVKPYLSKEIDFNFIEKLLETLFALFKKIPGTPCHRDIHPGNRLYNGADYFAIDFTWASMDDPYVDLAAIALFECDSPEDEHYFMSLYLNRVPTRAEIAHLNLAKQISKLFYALQLLMVTYPQIPDYVPVSSSLVNGQHLDYQSLIDCSSQELINLCYSLLQEVISYAKGDEYEHDLAAFSETQN